MTAIQVNRLKQDSVELEAYALKLQRRGLLDRMRKILEKKEFLDKKIAAA